MALVFWLSSRQRLPHAPGFDFSLQAIAGHLVSYAGLGWLLADAARANGSTPRQAIAIALVSAVLYGVSDEFHQSFVPGRHSDPLDVLTDGIGAALSLLLWWRLDLRRTAPAPLT